MTKSKSKVYMICKRVEARNIMEALKNEKQGVIESAYENKQEPSSTEDCPPIGFGSKTNVK